VVPRIWESVEDKSDDSRRDWFRRHYLDATGEYPYEAILQAWAQKARMPSALGPDAAAAGSTSAQTVRGERWTNIGPAPQVYDLGWTVSGRIATVWPTGGNVIYVGGASGGVWKSVNSGQSWEPKTDGTASLAMGSLAVDPQDPSIVYAGTGEYSNGTVAFPGAGVLRSFDGGETWTDPPLGADPAVFGGRYISRVRLRPDAVADPRTQRIVYVTASTGFFRSPDSGQSWKLLQGGSFSDVVIDPINANILYAARSDVGIYRWVEGTSGPPQLLSDANGHLPVGRFSRINLAIVYDPRVAASVLFASFEDRAAGGSFKGIWKTADGGAHWTRVTGPPRQFADGAWATADLLEQEPVDQQGNNDTCATAENYWVGQVLQGRINSSTDVDIYRFMLAGDHSMTLEIAADRLHTGLKPRLTLLDSTGKALASNSIPLADPDGTGNSSDSRIEGWDKATPGTYYAKVEGMSGTSGYYQLSLIGIEQGCQCGYDQAIAVDPGDPDTLYMGLIWLFRSRDGGRNWTQISDHGAPNWIHPDIQSLAFEPGNPQTVYVASDGGVWRSDDRGDHWIDLNTNLSLAQPFHLSMHPTDPGFALGGTQDNAFIKYDHGIWKQWGWGDGCMTAIVSQNEWYLGGFGLDLRKTVNNGANMFSAVSGLDRSGIGYDSPFVIDPTNSRVLIAGGGRRVGSVDQHMVYRSNTGAERGIDGENAWFANSPDLGAMVTALAFAKSDTRTYYAGTLNGRIWRGSNSGGSWTEVTKAPLPVNREVSSLAVDPFNPSIAYATYIGWGGEGHVFRTADGGASWQDISHGATPLPSTAVYSIVVDPNYPNTVFIGTQTGIYRSLDAGTTWENFDYGMPKLPVFFLLLSETAGPAGTMRAVTQGRGIWELVAGNDDCETATAIGDGHLDGSTYHARPQGAATCGYSSDGPDVWYRYTATCDGELRANTCESSYDTVLSVLPPPCPGDAREELACNDRCAEAGCDGVDPSCLTAPVEQGTEYLLRVAGYNGASGDFQLDVSCTVPNDLCDDAVPLPGVPGSVSGGTRGAHEDYAPSCQGINDTGPGVWYTVTGTGDTMTASLCNEGTDPWFDSQLTVYCAGCGGKQCTAADDDACRPQSEISWCAAPGRTYHILVHGYGTASGRFQLDVTDDGVSCGPFYVNCVPSNDGCAQAAPISTVAQTGDNTDAGTSGSASCAVSNGDVWYEFAPRCNGFATVSTCGGGTLSDTVLSIYDSCGGREIDCNDDYTPCSRRSYATAAHLANDPLLIRVAGYGSAGNRGTFAIDVDESIPGVASPWPDLYVSRGAGLQLDHLQRLDPYDLLLTDVGPFGLAGISALEWVPGLGLMYGVQDAVDQDQFVTIDPATGVAAPFAQAGYPAIRGLAWDASTMTLYASEVSLGVLLAVDPYTGRTRQVGSLGFGDVEGLALDPLTGTLYGADAASDQLIAINKTTGAGQAVGPFGGSFDRIEGLAFDTVHRILYGVQNDVTSGDGRLVTINAATGAATQLGGAFANMGATGLTYVEGLPEATAGHPYEAQLPASGGCPAYHFSDATGLPLGLSMDASGRITGTTTFEGTYYLEFAVADSSISNSWISAATPLRVRPHNDGCADASTARDGTTPFRTVYATTDGPSEPVACAFFGDPQVGSDVWFCHEATCTGTLSTSVCNANYDTKLALYEGCGCPAPGAAACNDDSCGVQSALSYPVVAGRQYAIRIGGYRGTQGSGELLLQCAGEAGGACCRTGGCTIETATSCAASGGLYVGAGSTCMPDSDRDGVIDGCDGCPFDMSKTDPGACGCGSPETDTDADSVSDCVDPDIDADGVPNADDCAPYDYATYPGAFEVNDGRDNNCFGDEGFGTVDEISGDGFWNRNDRSEYSWHAQRFATLYQIDRATDPRFPAPCTRAQVAAPVWNDPEIPPAGGALFYLVRANAPNMGSWGVDSSGVERTGVCE
jgi:hypothetical protein